MISVRHLAEELRTLDRVYGSSKALTLFISYAQKRGLTDLLPHVLGYIKRTRARAKQDEIVSIESPYPLSKKVQNDIRSYIGASDDTESELHIDEELIGGFRASYNSKQYDATLRGTLERLHKSLNA